MYTLVLHETARPFVFGKDFSTLLEEPCENAIYGAPILFTVIKRHFDVEGILDS